MFIQLFDNTLPSFRGIEPSSSAVDIKKAYRKAALRHYPDKVLYFFFSIVTLIVLLSNSSYATGQYISCQEWKYQRCCMERDNKWNPQGCWLFIQNNWKGICYAFRPYNGMHHWDIFHIFSLLLLLVLYFFTFFLPELSCQMSGHYFGWDLSCLMLLITIGQALRL